MTTAVVITYVTCGLTVVATLGMLGLVLWLGDPILDSFDGSGFDSLRFIVVATALVVVVWSSLAIWLAVLVHRRRRWARLALAASAVTSIPVSLMGVYYTFPVAALAAATQWPCSCSPVARTTDFRREEPVVDS